MSKQVAFMVGPDNLQVQEINGEIINQSWAQLEAEQPEIYFTALDPDDVADACMNIDDAASMPTMNASVNGGPIQLYTAVDFIGGRPPRRPS